MAVSAGAMKRKGICRATEIRKGMAFGRRCMCTSPPDIGVDVMESRKTLGLALMTEDRS